MEAPNHDLNPPAEPLSYAYPTTILRSVLPLPIAMTLIICGTLVMLIPVIVTTMGSHRIGTDPDTEVVVLVIAGLVGAAMIVFGVLKSVRHLPP